MDGSPYRLYRLESVPESRELPPGRYVLFKGKAPRLELELFAPVSRDSVVSAVRCSIVRRPVG